MAQITLKEVVTKADKRNFLEMPLSIYADDKNWVRPLDNDIENIFSPLKNKLFDGGEAIRWIAIDEAGQCVGRIAAFYNNKLATSTDIKTGGCGFFECIEDKDLAFMLFDAASVWLVDRGMQAMDGPINFGDRDYFWGLLVEGFYPPIYNMNYNKPYYKEFFESYGFQNYFNQHTYIKAVSFDAEINEVIEAKSKRLAATGEFEFKPITKKDYPFISDRFRDIYNKAWSKFIGVVPMTKEQSDQLFKEIKPIIDNDLIYFAYHNGRTVGFFIMVPNINDAIRHLNGKFNWWAKLKFMYHLKVRKSCRTINAMIFAVDPEYQGKGIESGIMDTVRRGIGKSKKYDHLELVWVGDFNPLMMRMIETYVMAKRYKMHTTYRFMLDKSIEFSRCPKVSVARKPRVKKEEVKTE